MKFDNHHKNIVLPSQESVKKETFHLLIGITGSVSAIKIPELIEYLTVEAAYRKYSLEIRCVATQSSLHFLPKEFQEKLLTDENEWLHWQNKGDPVLHIELRKWADLFAIIPLDANTMAKLSNGICDNLLTCIARAWDFEKPILICPSMNTLMYEHPLTEKQLTILSGMNYKILDPISKKLACGDTGIGALPETKSISKFILDIINGFYLTGK